MWPPSSGNCTFYQPGWLVTGMTGHLDRVTQYEQNCTERREERRATESGTTGKENQLKEKNCVSTKRKTLVDVNRTLNFAVDQTSNFGKLVYYLLGQITTTTFLPTVDPYGCTNNFHCITLTLKKT